MDTFIQKIYKTSPGFLQTIFMNGYAFKIHKERFGTKFTAALEEFGRNEKLSYGELLDLQNDRLRVLIRHAHENVPYYRRVMDERKIKPEDIKNVSDLRKLPLLTREDVKRVGEELIAKNVKKRNLIMGHTSGTTGSPLELYWDQKTCIYNNAADWRQKNWAGLKYREPYAVLLGRMIVPRDVNSPPFWRMNYLHNQLWLSSFHMSERNLSSYINKLEEYKPRIIEGYPSTVYILAKYLESKNKKLPLAAVLTSSETLYPMQKEVIEKSFECRVFDFYGLAERVIFATECDKHKGKHLNMDYGITEIVTDRGEPAQEGKEGWLVGTSLHNYGMPFIRYKTNDVSSIKVQECSCGRAFPLMGNVTTKAEDIVVTKDGRHISPSVLTHPFKPLHNIKMSQIIQEDGENIRIKIIKGDGYSEKDTDILLSAFYERVGADMKVKVEFVDSIERTNSGKFKWVISKVSLRF